MSTTSLPAIFPTDWSLGAIAASLPPLPYERFVEEEEDGLPHPLYLWYRLNYYFAAKNSHHDELSQLDIEQRASYQLLHDWWTAKYQDASFCLAAILEILDDVDPETMLNEADLTEESKRAFDTILSHLRLDRWPVGDIVEPAPQEDPESENQHYHERLWFLFKCEFLFESCYNPIKQAERSFANRRGARKQAAVYAYCQKLGWLALSEASPHSVQAQDLPLKYSESATQDAVFNIGTIGPVVRPCPWLDYELDDLQNLPRYLWDREKCCTIESESLDPQTKPGYIAISHTWGRWATGEKALVEGVSWLIPKNTKFDVEDLPRILKSAPGNDRYIWLDLLCIPQDGSIIGAQEIARQAKIFQGARLAVAWLNEVSSFEGLGSIVRWMSLELMLAHTQHEERLARAADAAWSEVSGKVSGLLEPREGSLQFSNLTLNPWFTSLWTLQEACLRPDMWLCAADWTFLAASQDLPVSIVGFVAILETWSKAYPGRLDVTYDPDPEKQHTIALYEITHWRFTSGMDKLLDLDQTAIVALGDRRHCEKRRAEAIMSALGVTEWYRNAMAKDEIGKRLDEILEKNLVLGKYPLDFVNELAAKNPAAFFSGFERRIIELSLVSVEPSILHGPAEGTLLPFSRHRAYFNNVNTFKTSKIHSITHESLSTWKIQANGSVKIPQACLMSSRIKGEEKIEEGTILPVLIIGYIHGDRTNTAPLPSEMRREFHPAHLEHPLWMSLHHWVVQQPNEVFALLTEYRYADSPECLQGCGIILEMIDGVLIKTWYFVFQDDLLCVDVAQSQQVDFLVS
ncbi:hypothetical protein EJ04DRAFT_594023 [Polyplosphaeria fusca]|uniref:Heterokaryon incompatibility domain-containing protein n=1 Tax=Polyplosphaeria fusca TaxID=682080 RepID=A0A9P4QMU6_9PLEO|nr:hypothetical protein EJ04DRAFT_594023 [Polyplosphaeria fusca]